MLMIQEVTLDTANPPANLENSGIQITYVPKDGGNRFTVTATANGSGPQLQAHNLDDHLRSRGLQTEPSRLKHSSDLGVGLGGPIQTDRLWFYSSVRRWGAQNTV